MTDFTHPDQRGAPLRASASFGKPPSQHSIHFFDCAQLAPETWANGGGITRTIAKRASDDGGIEWRVSLAALNGPGRFSQFPGLDRTLLLLDDGALDLHSQDGAWFARPGQPVQFSGDLLIWASVRARPVEVLNVMTRRGACQARVNVASHSLRITAASTQLVLCVEGQWGVTSALLNGVSLQPMTGIWIDGRREEIDRSAVYGGALNLDGVLRIQVTHAGKDSTLGKIIALMQHAEQAKPPVTQVLERHMGAYLALVLLIAAIVWFTSANASAMLAVIVAACPCALVLAAPSTAIAGIAVGARHGILFRNAAFLDKIAEVDSLVIDKTGTLTRAELQVRQVWPQPGVDAAQARALAARLGESSAHPASRALVRDAVASGLTSADVAPFERTRELRGLGVIADTPAGTAVLGRPTLLADHAGDLPPAPDGFDGPLVGLVLGGRLLAWFGFADTLRPDAREALAELRTLGLARQTLLTGDLERVAGKVAAETGIETVVAQALPHDKLDYVMREIGAGLHPLVVGDGLNDVLAIKAGSTSIAMGERGVDIAIASADIVLLGDDLRRIPTCIRLGRQCRRTATTNAAIGLAWTLAVIALAATGMLGAVWAAILHNVGTFIVIANAGRLLRIDDSASSAFAP
ncbi:Cd2+/Zn2+-exporting ATPase [Paraburkholderia sp. JPY465]|uniref:HutD family protein n=1 Tax=Paraburkholderia sp. JPY465 TaxID=3042285 RepID=UPI003D256291